MKIVLATHNKDKCLEMMEILSNLNIELLTLNDLLLYLWNSARCAYSGVGLEVPSRHVFF